MPRYAKDDRSLDSIGRPARRLRYPVALPVKISTEAHEDLRKMAEERGSKVATIMRRAVMKEIYIDKAKKEKRNAKHA